MTHGGADGRRIRIRLSGDQPQDLRALQRWLGLEEWFTEAETRYGLRVVYRERDGTEQTEGPDGPAMGGVVTEIVLMIASGVLTPVFDDLYRHAKTSVQAFATNLSSNRRSIDAEVTAEDATGDATNDVFAGTDADAHAAPDPDPSTGPGPGTGTGTGTGPHDGGGAEGIG